MVGREKELAELKRAFEADESQLIAIYGRRRIGKTYLVNAAFNSSFAFHHSGLKRGDLKVERLGRGYAWLDTGTHEAMLDAGNFIRTIETRQGLQVACLQEIAYQNGWMTKDQVRESCKDLLKTEYGKYLIRMIEE